MDGEPHLVGGRLAGAGPGLAGLGALALHGRVEGVRIDGHALGAQRVLGEVEGKAVGVVQLERDVAGQLAAGAEVRRRLVEQPEAPVQGSLEPGFLQLQGLGDQGFGADQLGKRLAHLGDEDGHQPPQEGLGAPHQLRVTHGAAHDAAQDVSPPLVGRQHAVGDEEAGRPQVIGDDPVGDLVRAIRIGARGLRRRRDQGAKEVDLVIVVGALEHGGGALQPHAGVDGRFGQGDALVRRHLLELHEHQVPDLDEAVAVLVRAAGRAAGDVVAVVVEDLRARPAGTGFAHGPEVVRRGYAENAPFGESGDLLPQVEGVVVLGIDGDEQPVPGQAVLPGHQLPRQLDGHVLEVVAEREVAQHLEERVVAGGVADVFQIVVLAPGAHAFLRRHRARIVAGLEPGEDVLELHHAGVGEQQGGVVARHQRARLHDPVSVAGEEFEKRLANVVDRLHGL